MEEALFNSNMYWCLVIIFGVLGLSVITGTIYKYRPKMKESRNWIWPLFGTKDAVYASGTLLWLVVCLAITRFLFVYADNTEGLTLSNLYYLLLAPFIGLIIYLIWNLLLGIPKPKAKGANEYKLEVDLIMFVERHANYMILGITGVFIAVQFWQGDDLNLSIFYLFMILSMLFAVCGVLPLIWSPKEDAEHLEWLRNFKTVWYGYSIYLFFAGIISLAIAIL